jgi:L-histidine N-alpha-methyltransferase
MVTGEVLMAVATASVTVTAAFDPQAHRQALLDDVRRGLTSMPKEISPRWLYDERGSLLFEEITRLPEYYPTRQERSILSRHAAEVARLSRAEVLVELGAGSSEKTRFLLEALRNEGTLRAFVPFDLSEPMLRNSAPAIARDFPGLSVHAVVGDFEHHLRAIPREGPRMVAFLGGTIGNLAPEPRARFLRDLARGLAPGETFLLGTDLVKSHQRLNAAYNDAAGVTAAFNLNVLRVLNRELDADFDLHAFQHRAWFDPAHAWIEMLLVSERAQRVHLPALGIAVDFGEGEALRTEVSCKFRREQVEAELAAAGLRLEAWWTDADGDFALSLSRRS